MSKKTYDLTDKAIRRYALHLREQERAPATVQKYVQDLTAACGLAGRPPADQGRPDRVEGVSVRQPRPSYRQLHAGRRQWFLSLHGLEGHRRKAVENTKGPLLR